MFLGRSVEVLDVDVEHDVIELVLVNLGNRVATEVEVAFSETLSGLAGSTVISDLPLWSSVRTLRPGKEVRVLLDSSDRLNRTDDCLIFDARVRWRSRFRTHRATYRHDLNAYRSLPTRVGGDAMTDPREESKIDG